MGGTLAFGPVVGGWLAAGVDFFITLVDNNRVKRGLAAPPAPDVAPARLVLNTGLNGAMFLAAGYAFRAVAGPNPLVAVTPRTLGGIAAFLAAVEIVNVGFDFLAVLIRDPRRLATFARSIPAIVIFDIPLLPPAVALALLAGHGMTWGLACASASLVLASVLLYRRDRLDLVVNRYVSNAKSSEILANPYELTRTERRDISVIFGDLRGTTGISQTLPPDEMLALLNAFHAGMIDEVAGAGGTVDKLLGDGLMVLMGAPVRMDDHAARAVALAIAMQKRHRAIRTELARRGLPAPGMGVGIASGEVVIGNVGSELRLDYTAIGGEVNLASKLCAAAGADEILISRACRDRAAAARAAGRASELETVAFEDRPPVTVTRMERALEPVKVVYA
jgi:class 3 adenylate cyclase